MRDSRELCYHASILKALFLLVFCTALTAFGWQMLVSGGDVVASWVMIGLFGLLTLGMLAALLFAVLRRTPLLAINSVGITYFPPGESHGLTVPWDDVAHIGIDTQDGARGVKSYYLAIQARHLDRYASVHQRVMRAWLSAAQGVAIAVPLDLLFLWPSRARREQLLERIQQTFAPEIIQYCVEVDEQEPFM